MDPLIEKFIVLLVLGFAMMLLNLKAGMTALKFITLWVMVLCFVGAAYFAALVVLHG